MNGFQIGQAVESEVNDMADVFSFRDDLGPEKIVHLHDPATGLKAIVVVDNVAAGPAIGGTRMAPDVSLEECVRLARAMTLKNAAAAISHGGAKSVIFGDPKMPIAEKEKLIRSFAYAVKGIKDYIPGPDMGTDETCMGWVRDVTGRASGLPREVGGIPLDEIGATGYGLVAAIDVAKDFIDLDLRGARIVVQGFGAVGTHAAKFLGEKGSRLIATSDSRGAIFNSEGLDIAALIDWKHRGNTVADFAGGKSMGRDEVIDIACDIWIPAARPDAITEDNVSRFKTKLIAEGANIPSTYEAEKYLAEHGVLVLPDFIANAGGVICAAVEYQGGTQSAALAEIDEKIRFNVQQVLTRSRREGILPRDAALIMAEARVRKAMSFRKTF